MAFNSATQWEVQVGGSDSNGGGFSSAVAGAGTDYSQQASPQLNVSDAACSGNTTLTSATGGFTAAMVGNVLYLSTGDRYQITGYTDTNTVTLDRNGPSSSGMTCNVGGCLASPGVLSNLPVSGNKCWVKAGTYTITTSTSGASGPYYQSSSIRVVVEGYSTSRGDRSGDVILSAGAIGSVTLWRTACFNQLAYFVNLQADGNGQASIIGFQYNGSQLRSPYLCRAVGCATGFLSTGGYRCRSENCTYGFVSELCFECVDSGSTTGFWVAGADACIAEGSTSGFVRVDFGKYPFTNCLAINCVYGFVSGHFYTRFMSCNNCIAHTCTYGYYLTISDNSDELIRCGVFNCTTNVATQTPSINDLTVFAVDPLVDSAGGDYTITSNAMSELVITPWIDEAWVLHAGAVPPVGGGGGFYNPFRQPVMGEV